MKLYKYISPKVLAKVFEKNGDARVKCSYPKDYNDPYELFVRLDTYDDHEVVSYFNEVVSNIPQLPTTCFSKRPDVIPMWAHYGDQSKGFVLEIDENILKKYVTEAVIGNVKYKKDAEPIESSYVGFALARGKFRHALWLQQSVINSAYFFKNSCWRYEQERRLVVNKANADYLDTNMILSFPQECVTAIISGPFASAADVDVCLKILNKINSKYFMMKIGKSTSTPFFLNINFESFIFKNRKLIPAKSCCSNCGEPIESADEYAEECHWCMMTDDDKIDAADKNPLRVLHQMGLLEDYLQKTKEI